MRDTSRRSSTSRVKFATCRSIVAFARLTTWATAPASGVPVPSGEGPADSAARGRASRGTRLSACPPRRAGAGGRVSGTGVCARAARPRRSNGAYRARPAAGGRDTLPSIPKEAPSPGRSLPATTMTGKSDHAGCASIMACRFASDRRREEFARKDDRSSAAIQLGTGSAPMRRC